MDTLSIFSKSTLAILHSAGWSEEYRHDTTEDERLLKEEGYPIFPVILEFLKRFGGIHFRYPHRVNYGTEFASFGAVAAVASTFFENVQIDVEELGVPLCLVGICYSGNMWVMMDEEGYVYTDYGSEMFLLGTSGEDAIEALCTKRGYLDIVARIQQIASR
jgi:hypothetical protein